MSSPSWTEIAREWSTVDVVGWLNEARARDPNIVGLGFGEKRKAGRSTGQIAAVVLVRRKRAPRDPELRWMIPPRLRGLATDVVEKGPDMQSSARAIVPTDDRVRGGGRVDIDRRPWGTLGCTVTRDTEGGPQRFVLSNAHVIVPQRPLVAGGAAGPCEAVDAEPVTVYDDHRLARRRRAIGILSRYVPLVSENRGFNLVDGATAEVTSEVVADGIEAVGEVGPACRPDELRLGDRVLKVGAASRAAAEGSVRVMRLAYVLKTGDYGVSGSGSSFVFAEQLAAQVHQVGGDSGSVLVREDRRAVGLVHARHPHGLAIAAPAWTVEASLGIRFGGLDP